MRKAVLRNSLLSIIDDLDKCQFKLFMWCIFNADKEGNVNITKPMCEKITNQIGLSYQTTKNSITKLKSAGLLISLGSGLYSVNKEYYVKTT